MGTFVSAGKSSPTFVEAGAVRIANQMHLYLTKFEFADCNNLTSERGMQSPTCCAMHLSCSCYKQANLPAPGMLLLLPHQAHLFSPVAVVQLYRNCTV